MKTNKLTAIVLLLLVSFISAKGQNQQNSFSGALYNISSWLGTLDTEQLIEKIPQNSQGKQMICVGSSKYMQFTDFIEAADTSDVLKTLIDRYSLKSVNPDSIPDSLSDYYYYFKLQPAYPFFTVINKDGDLVSAGTIGYNTPEELIALTILSESDFPTANSEDVRETYRKLYNKYQRRLNFRMRSDNMMEKGHHLDFSVGYGLYAMSGNGRYGNSGILSADIGFRQDISNNRKVRLCTGLAVDHVFDATGQTRLSIPLETELTVKSGYPQIKCRAGLWGGRTFVKQQFRNDYSRYEAGAACSLMAKFGNFDLSLGYKRGFTNLLTAPGSNGYSNSLTLSIRLELFD